MLPVITFLQAAVQNKDDLDLSIFDLEAFQWILEAGFGPLLYRTSQNSPAISTFTRQQSALLSADLTARVLTGVLLDALDEILISSSALAQDITLLKGISLCQRHYPEPHIRTMGDIDILVPAEIRSKVESKLRDLGYSQQSEYPEEFFSTHHHSMPFFHPAKHVWIEVHTALFPLTATVANDRVFSPQHIATQIMSSTDGKFQTNHLTDEMNIIYLCSHWAETFNQQRGLIPVLDVIYILMNKNSAINWDKILAWLQNSMASAHLYLMLTFLQRQELISVPAEVIRRLALTKKNLNKLNNRILHALIMAYLVRGKPFTHISSETNVSIVWSSLLSPRPATMNLVSIPWKVLFPPSNPKRMNLGFQLHRIRSALKKR